MLNTHPDGSRTSPPNHTDTSNLHSNSIFRHSGRSRARSRAAIVALVIALAAFTVDRVAAQTWNWRVYSTDNSPIGDNFVLAVAIDSSGQRWVGTRTAGLSRITGHSWTRFDRSNTPLPSDTIISILVQPDGTCWFGTHNGGLVSYRDDEWRIYDTNNSGLRSNDISGNAFILGEENSLWVGTWGGGISHYNDGNWTTYDTGNSPLPDQTVWTACIDRSGALWIGTLNGLARYSDGLWRVYTTQNSCIPLNDIAALCADNDGSIWIGTWGAGIARFDGKNWIRFNSLNSPLREGRVEALTFDAFGRLWIGSWGGGIAIYDRGNWIVLDSSNTDLPSDNVRTILHDARQEKMWICTDQGLAVCDYRHLSTVTETSSLPVNANVASWDRGDIRLLLDASAYAFITIISVTGEHVATLANSHFDEGEHFFSIPSNVPPGLYYCSTMLNGKYASTVPVLVSR